ncbi:MAG TPA: type IV secretion system DNA-binding domain-containing protein [Steroidobacteraceae bacterium]|nr:type IV secretion system DNA-binding domain-containing protein [Steroidobacteraceae bacterium]
MIRSHLHLRSRSAAVVIDAAMVALLLPALACAQTSPFLTGATALQTNILAWLTPIAVILVMVLGAMAMANRIVENCGNTLILRCAGSEHGGTSQFASRLIGEREVVRPQRTRARDRPGLAGRGRRSLQISEQQLVELAVLASELEQLPDLAGYLKTASSRQWLRVQLRHR